MELTLRLTTEEQKALEARAKAVGLSTQEAVRRAVRNYVASGRHRERVSEATRKVIDGHAGALKRLGE